MNTGIEKKYQLAIQSQEFKPDPAQLKVVKVLQAIQDSLLHRENRSSNLLSKMLRQVKKQPAPVKGLYLWGDVGRGKTWLMNLFLDSLESNRKLRLHFHHFMIDIHERLGGMSGQREPLKKIASDYAKRYQVICLDEFIVTNITDAMLLYGLLDALFEEGVTLIATSNRIPDELYKNGLQRERFLPAIELIKKHTRIKHLDAETDFRLALLEQTDTYITPITDTTDQYMYERMSALATDDIETASPITVHRRPILTRYLADEIAWFDFDALCDAPRAATDYIEIAGLFHTILISDIPVMDEYLDDKARRFIYLIDELYDRSVKVIISAHAPEDLLYTGELLKFAFKRTASRLVEMRSENYLSQPHHLESRKTPS